MKINVDKLSNELSVVRGIGSYNQMLSEGIAKYGDKYKLALSNSNYDINLITDFNFYGRLEIKPSAINVLVTHDLIPLKYPKHFPVGIKGKYRFFMNKRTIKCLAGIITDSNEVKKELVQKLNIPTEKIEVVYPSVKAIFIKNEKIPLPNFAKKLPKDFILYVGDVTWNKNLLRLALAVKEIDRSLVLVGKALSNRDNLNHPWQKSFQSFLKEVGFDKRFIFMNYLNDNELLWLYRNTKVVALPSLDEGFGLTWLEASFQGTPVLVGKTKLAKEIMRDAAYFVDPLSVDSIVSGLKKLILSQNKQLIIKQLERAQELLPEQFIASLSKALYNFSK